MAGSYYIMGARLSGKTKMRFKLTPLPPNPKWGSLQISRFWVPISKTTDGYTVLFGFVYIVQQFRGIEWHDVASYSSRDAAENLIARWEKQLDAYYNKKGV